MLDQNHQALTIGSERAKKRNLNVVQCRSMPFALCKCVSVSVGNVGVR